MSEAVGKVAVACPRCGKRYLVAPASAGKRGRCACGVEFNIPALGFGQVEPEVAPASASVSSTERSPAAAHCAWHPAVPAAFACARCHALMCTTCDFRQLDGSHLCPTCATQPSVAPAGSFSGALASPYARVEPGVRCRNHPEVDAVARCSECSTPICGTCDFQFPGGLHYCPTCATRTSRPLSSGRKSLVIWSMLMAGWVTVFLGVLLSGAMADAVTDEAGAFVVGLLIMVPALAGIGLACGSLNKRAGNPPIVWVAVVWNGIMVGVWLLLCIIGSVVG